MDQAYVDILISRAILVAFVILGLVIASIVTAGLVYLFVIITRLRKRESSSFEMTTLEVQLSKDNEIKVDSADQMFAAFSSLKKSKGWLSFMDLDETLAFEIVAKKSDIRFYISAPSKIVDLVEKTIYGFYPAADIKQVDEPNIFSEDGTVAFASLRHADEAYKPLKTYKDIPSDTMANITSALSKMDDNEGAIIQMLIKSSNSKMKGEGKSYIKDTKKNEADPAKAKFDTDQKTLEKISEKLSKPWFETVVRIVVSASSKDMAEAHLRNITNALSQLDSEYNKFEEPKIWFKAGFM
ncbi:MAG: hypothetical protein Q7T50_03585, partial [Candidatus Magasanikbacteria bacterium]|nr:hypothetical protein [Candidatus Magasanikbacteria bacterium]